MATDNREESMSSEHVTPAKAITPAQTVILAVIRLYRYAFSALFGNVCRFEPTCSDYSMRAIQLHGCAKGCYYALRRLLRCHPWHPGGIDPLP
jgi:putative membrane protein insertion efficiency factor